MTVVLNRIWSVFPPVDSAYGRDFGAQASRLAGVFQAGSVTGTPDFGPGVTGT